MRLLNQILRGIVIGVANIIPGVSGGTMMVSMGIYDTLIHCITHLFSEFKKSIKTLLPYAVGMLIGIVALASLLTYLFEHFPLPTNTAFIGLILGGLGPIFRKIDRRKINAAAVIAFILAFALIIWMALKGEVQNADTIRIDAVQVLILIAVGAVASATMIIPGVSGSMMLMLLGYYTPVLNALSNFKDALFHLDFAAMGQPLLLLLPFALGIVLGIYFVAKAIEWLLKRYATPTYCCVLGLVLASPVAILIRNGNNGVNTQQILISIVTFAVGFIAAMLLARGSKEEAVCQKQ